MNPSVSVIVPIYNQEGYLRRSLDSLANQTLQDFEVLLIDDGSLDTSSSICDEYCRTYSMFHLLKKENGGVASARQLGLSMAIGDYVIHVDPDDYVEPDFLEKLYLSAIDSDTDMVVCDYVEEFENEQRIFHHDSSLVSKSDELFNAIVSGKVWGVLWNKLIRRSCISNLVDFEEGINIQEDKLFLCRAFRRIKKVSYLDEALYHYNRQNANSILGNPTRTKGQVIQKWEVIKFIVAEEPNVLKKRYLAKLMVNASRILELWTRNDISPTEYYVVIKDLRIYMRRIIKDDKTVSTLTKIILYLSTFKTTSRLKSLMRVATVRK